MTTVKKNQVIVLKRPGENSERVHLGDELKSGGAGFVYSIKDDSSRVIKIYRPETLTSEGTTYQKKIECMLGNVPNVSKISSGDEAIVQLAWPLASAYTIHDEFVGFAMPMVDMQSTTELEYVLSRKQAEKAGLPHHLGVGVSLAHNLAAVVSSIHALGHAIVDLKPANLKYYKKELYVAVLDCDGFYINVPGKTTSAPQVTADYLAPEFQPKLPTDKPNVTVPEHQDMFSLAVIIFKLLNFDIHPYDAVPINGAKIPSGREEKIRAGLYPYGIVPHKKVSPVPASTHETFPAELRVLFDRAFGGNASDRPKATEWAGTLKKFAEKSKGLLEHCTHQHLHFKDMHCATCLREQILIGAIPGNRSKQNLSRTPSSAPHLHAAPSQPQVVAASSSGNLQQVTSPAQQTQSQATAQSAATNAHLLERILASEYAVPHIVLFIASLIAGFFIGLKFWIALIFIAIILYRYQTDDRDDFFSPRTWHSLYGGVCLSGLIFAGMWTYGYFHSDKETGKVESTKNVEADESRQAIAKNPVTINTKQADEKQESPQDTAPQTSTWANWPKNWPTTSDSPITQETPPIAVQESDNRSNTDRIPVAGSTVGQTNENKSGTQGWLGLDAQPLTPERASSMNLGSAQRGIIINNVVMGGPADKAGVVAGDLLVAVDEKAIDTDDSLQNVLSKIPVGRVVPIKVIREGNAKYLIVTIGQKP